MPLWLVGIQIQCSLLCWKNETTVCWSVGKKSVKTYVYSTWMPKYFAPKETYFQFPRAFWMTVISGVQSCIPSKFLKHFQNNKERWLYDQKAETWRDSHFLSKAQVTTWEGLQCGATSSPTLASEPTEGRCWWEQDSGDQIYSKLPREACCNGSWIKSTQTSLPWTV